MANSKKTRSSAGVGEGILFSTTSEDRYSAEFTVKDSPIHVVANFMPPGDEIVIERLHDTKDCCLDVPPSPVMTCCGCSELMLFNQQAPDCQDERRIQNDVWLTAAGRYRLFYKTGTVGQNWVYFVRDTVAGPSGALGGAPYNCCPDHCKPLHVITGMGPPANNPPDCLKCEAPIYLDLAPGGCIYYWAAPLGTSCSDAADCCEEASWHAWCLCDELAEVFSGQVKTIPINDAILLGGHYAGQLDVSDAQDGSVIITITECDTEVDVSDAQDGSVIVDLCRDGSTDSTIDVSDAQDGSVLATLPMDCTAVNLAAPPVDGQITFDPSTGDASDAVWATKPKLDCDGNPILGCDGEPLEEPVRKTIELPSVCDLLAEVPPGAPLVIDPGDPLTIFDPDTCTIRPVTFSAECCECYEEVGFAAGGGVCFQVTSSPGVNSPTIFRGRDLSFIRGSGTNAFDLNGVGLVTVPIQNPWSDCPTSFRATMRIMANRSLGSPDTGVGFIYMLSETLAEPLPTDSIVLGANNPASSFATNFQNIGYVTLDVINNYDLSHEGEALNTNYSAHSGANVFWSGQLGAGGSSVLYGQWWATLAAVGGTSGSTGVIYGHATMQVTVQYFQGGIVSNAIQK